MPVTLTVVESTTTLGIETVEVVLVSSSTPGPAGPGVPTGGTDGQVLTKTSASDYATAWEDPTGGGGASAAEDVEFTPTGNLASIEVQSALEELDAEKAALSHAHAGADITSGTVDIARLPSTLATDVEVAAAVSAHEAAGDPHPTYTTAVEVLAAIASALAGADGAALTDNGSGVLSVAVDDTTIEISSDAIRVKSGSITTAHLAFDPATQAELDAAISGLSVVYQAKDVTLDTYAGIDPSANVQSILGAANYAAIRTLLGLVIGTNVQAFDDDLTTYASITPSANVQSVLGAADYAAIRTLLGLVIGTNVQAYDADLTTYAGITPSANVQSFLGSANYAAMKTQLALTIGTDVQAYDADLTTYAGITPSANVQSLLAAASYAAMRALLDLEAGTDFPSLATFNDHDSRHEAGGGDEMSIAGLAGVPTELQTHLDDTTAHTAANIPFTPTGTIAGTDLQTAVAEVASERLPLVQLKVIADDETLATGDGQLSIFIPPELNGMNLIDADAAVSTVSSSGLPTIQIRNVTQTADMLSTRITIDVGEKTSYTAVAAPVIDTGNDDVATGDQLAVDVDVAGTGAKGLVVILKFGL